MWALMGVVVTGCGPRPGTAVPEEVVYRHRFNGLKEVGSREDLAQFRQVLALPESQEVVTTVSRRLASSIPQWFGRARLGTNDAVAYEPLVRALLDTETHLEVRVREGKISGWELAARVDPGVPAMAGATDSVLRLLGAAPASGAAPQGGHRVQPIPGGPTAEVSVEQGWLLMGYGAGGVDGFRSALKKAGRPGVALTNAVLEVEADLPRIARLAGLREKPPGPVDQWPSVRAQWAPRNGQLKTSATLAYARPHGLPMDAWQMPTNVLHDPLVGFTAARGAGTWLSRLGLFSDLGVTEWPKQLFLWSIAGDPWQQYFAAPIAAPTNIMAQISLTLPVRAVTNSLWSESIFSLRITNQALRVELRGLPYFGPFMEAQSTAQGEQVFGGLFPHAGGGRPAPAGLVAQVAGNTNLVLYDWETTGRRLVFTNPPGTTKPGVVTNDLGRLLQFKHLAQFARLMTSRDPSQLPAGKEAELIVPGGRWIDAALPLLRDSVTVVVQNGPAELTLNRVSVTGFNALELLYLLRWIDNPGFPGWTEPPPPPPRRAGGAAPGLPGAPPVPPAPPAAPGALPPPVKAPGTP